MELDFGAYFVFAIAIGCYVIFAVLKPLLVKWKATDYIPAIVALVGLVLGIALNPLDNIILSAIAGGFSGLASTGLDQLVKKFFDQFKKTEE